MDICSHGRRPGKVLPGLGKIESVGEGIPSFWRLSRFMIEMTVLMPGLLFWVPIKLCGVKLDKMISSNETCIRCRATYEQGCLVGAHGLVCNSCNYILNNPREEVADTDDRSVRYTTVVIGTKGRVWDLGKSEYPGQRDTIINAYTCRVGEVPKRKK